AVELRSTSSAHSRRDVRTGFRHLLVDRLLHAHRVGDHAEHLLSPLPAGLHQEVSRTDHALEEALPIREVVDALERDLPPALRENTGTKDQTLTGQHHVGRRPTRIAADEAGEHEEDEEE